MHREVSRLFCSAGKFVGTTRWSAQTQTQDPDAYASNKGCILTWVVCFFSSLYITSEPTDLALENTALPILKCGNMKLLQ